MISFDTFSGPLGAVAEPLGHGEEPQSHSIERNRKSKLEESYASDGEEQRQVEDEDDCDAPLADQDSEEEIEYDIFNERKQAPMSRKHHHHHHHKRQSEESLVALPCSEETDPNQNTNSNNGGRIQQLFQLLTLKNTGDAAKTVLVHRLLGVNSITELLLSKATQDQIASAANDAIADEIFASVDLEDKRRQSLSQLQPSLLNGTEEHGRMLVVHVSNHHRPGNYSPYRVLELVDVLDSTTGGMVKRILTNVRRRTPFSQRGTGKDGVEKSIEFCSLCSAYGDHSSTQHRCRACGVAGVHRSRHCPRGASSTHSIDSDTSSFSPPESAIAPSSSPMKSYCTFCASWGYHGTVRHQCRLCGALGQHRSRNCTSKSSSTRFRGSPVDSLRDRKYCTFCGTWKLHGSAQHRCRVCSKEGDHRSKNCPLNTTSKADGARTPRYQPPIPTTTTTSSTTTNSLPASNTTVVREFCTFCSKKVTHSSQNHICRVCQAVGKHRSGDCPHRKESQSVLSYSVETASKVRDRVLEKILPASATTLIWDSIDKVADADTIVRKTLQRIGVWGGGSQTPITTPYAPPIAPTKSVATPLHQTHNHQQPLPPAVNTAGVYVLSYAEGHSVVPERILKYMRLLMHHEISVNAFSVVVRFDPRSSQWELHKPGMVTPRSLPTSPTMSEQLKKRMAVYTLQTLLGAREKLIKLIPAQQQQQHRQQQVENENHSLESHPTLALVGAHTS